MAFKLKESDIQHHFANFKQGTIDALMNDLHTVGEIQVFPIIAVRDDDDNIAITNRFAVFNLGKKENDAHGFVDIVSDQYKLIQPRLNMLEVVQSLDRAGVSECAWKISESARGHMACLNFLFKTKYVDPTGSDCFPGVQISTYSDGKGAVYMEFFWWRQVCTNGAKGNHIVDSVKIEHKGTQSDVDTKITEFLQKLAIGEKKLFEEVIPQAHEDLVEGERAWLLIGNLPERMQKRIMDRFVAGTEKNRYALYGYATEDIGMSGESTETIDRYLDGAEAILMNRPIPRRKR